MLRAVGQRCLRSKIHQGTSGSSTKLHSRCRAIPALGLVRRTSLQQHYTHCIAAWPLCELSPCATLSYSVMHLVIEKQIEGLIVELGSADSDQFSKTQWLDD